MSHTHCPDCYFGTKTLVYNRKHRYTIHSLILYVRLYPFKIFKSSIQQTRHFNRFIIYISYISAEHRFWACMWIGAKRVLFCFSNWHFVWAHLSIFFQFQYAIAATEYHHLIRSICIICFFSSLTSSLSPILLLHLSPFSCSI